MSLSSRIWISALFLVGTVWWVNGAAVPSSSGNFQPPPQKDGPDSQRNASAPVPADFKTFKPMEPTRPNSPNLPPPPQPFGINSNMQMPPQTPPQGFFMTPPPGFRPGMVMMPQPTMFPPIMNAPNQQQGQTQQPKLTNSTTMQFAPPLSSNATRLNNNTRRETEPSPATPSATTTSTTTTRKPFQELPLGADKQESDGSKMKQTSSSAAPQSLPVNPFNPMMQPLNPAMQQLNPMMQPFPMMNQPPLFIDPMGRLMMLVPFNPQLLPRDPNQQQALPQGPPIPIQVPPFNPQMQFQFGQPQLRPVMADLNKQTPPPHMGDASSKNATSTN
ncbi:protein EARLY FLOWERING 5-like [Daphnia pulex]|uniref:protein EARLY FLOWERING 5-like n=1 Tax=Daphnia pulex TaxID=6669 RepID=UPI001EDF6E84|nr:protein EARLY FLOWERING 5-like [Daphnia pulex]